MNSLNCQFSSGKNNKYNQIFYVDSRCILCVDEFRKAKVIMLASLNWWLYDGDRFKILVTEALYWRFISLCSVTNISQVSLTHFESIKNVFFWSSLQQRFILDSNLNFKRVFRCFTKVRLLVWHSFISQTFQN